MNTTERNEREVDVSIRGGVAIEVVSIDTIGDIVDTNLMTADEEGVRGSLRDIGEAILSPLDERERRVLDLRYNLITPGRMHSFREIGTAIGRSETTARRIERTALEKLRTPNP